MDDEEFARVLKKRGDVTGDDDVDIQKQRRALQIVQGRGKGGEFGPAAFGQACRQIQWWNRQRLYLCAQAAGIVGQADKAKIAAQVAAHHGVEAIDIFGAVFCSPLHAEDKTGLLRCIHWGQSIAAHYNA